MIRSILKAHGAGWRAGFTPKRLIRPGGTRGVLRLTEPLNPYCNPFYPRLRPLLAMAWENGRYSGMMQYLTGWLKSRKVGRV